MWAVSADGLETEKTREKGFNFALKILREATCVPGSTCVGGIFLALPHPKKFYFEGLTDRYPSLA